MEKGESAESARSENGRILGAAGLCDVQLILRETCRVRTDSLTHFQLTGLNLCDTNYVKGIAASRKA